MLCNTCNIAHICKIYDDVIKHSVYVNIEITGCKIKGVSAPVSKPVNKDNVFLNPFNELGKDRAKIEELSKANAAKEEANRPARKPQPKQKVQLDVKPLELDNKCASCGAMTFKEDVSKCNVCGKPVCSCCATVDSSSMDILCQQCWEQI